MLKIPKGLKKKKKGKKSKRKGEEELFTEEELEKYRREHQAQAPQQQQHLHEQEQEVASDTEQQQQQQQSQPAKENDEWSKFNALTTGVDSILKKTQGDLDRIKSTSFFQRTEAGPKLVDRCGKELPLRRDAQKEGQRWIGFEPTGEHTDSQRENPHQAEASAPIEKPPPVERPPSESESEEDDFDDIFDTSYVEAVEKGEVKLAYVPDSPEEEVDLGPDPFDTSYAEKVIKGPEVSKKGKKLVNIGAAVEVLTGRIDHVTTSSTAIKKAKRRIPRDLLLENPDPDDFESQAEDVTAASKSLLDDDTEDIPKDIPVDLSVSLHTQFITPRPEDSEKSFAGGDKDVLSTFDTLANDDEDDEFAQLASESLSKPAVVDQVVELPSPVAVLEPVLDDDSWASFVKSDKPSRPPPPKLANEDASSPDEFDLGGPDPFDTTFAENILPGQAELKQIENEILTPRGIPNSDSDFDFDPRADEKPYVNNRRKSSVHIHVTDPTGIRESISGYGNGVDEVELDTLKPIHRDLLGGSSTDLSQLADSPIAPRSATDDNDTLEYSDPFDTSIVDIITAPGKTELKFIEKELLGETGETDIKRSLSDPDFDPRADDSVPPSNSSRKPSRPENLFNKSVLFKLPTEVNCLAAEKDAKKGKPLTPYYNREASIVDEDVVVDSTQEEPFDATSSPIIISDKPVSSILKNRPDPTDIKRSSSDQDLNIEEEETVKGKFSQLRRHSDFPINFSRPTDLKADKKTDFLAIAEEESVDTKVLTPYQEGTQEDSFNTVDPFDTSSVGNVLLPGKTELKFLENELLTASDTLNDPDFDPRAGDRPQTDDLLAPSDDVFQAKALTPEITNPATGFLIDTDDNDIDPFDTSIADNIAPGKTELKLLESELMN